VIKTYQQIIAFLVESARKNAESRGVDFDEQRSTKMHEAALPLIIFYILVPLINFIAPNILAGEIYLIVLIFLILRGANHYFGWIKLIKKD
tara:strand:- start:497 stop:769 length:273 start_codon:yes stop_codon:yes gene_type:complete